MYKCIVTCPNKNIEEFKYIVKLIILENIDNTFVLKVLKHHISILQVYKETVYKEAQIGNTQILINVNDYTFFEFPDPTFTKFFKNNLEHLDIQFVWISTSDYKYINSLYDFVLQK
jgi:hypothetical protein